MLGDSQARSAAVDQVRLSAAADRPCASDRVGARQSRLIAPSRHYGPSAQDFFGAFGDDGLGTIGTPTTITSGDLEGILLIAVKAPERRTEEPKAKEAEIMDLKTRLAALEQHVRSRPDETARR